MLPTFNAENENSVTYDKINDSNNSAFVDGMFTYLTSQLLHTHNFPHALDYYGSFIGLKKNFVSNVVDELELLFESDYFEKNLGKLFYIDSIDKEKIAFSDTRNFKNRLKILGDNEQLEVLTIDNSMFEGVFEELPINNENTTEENVNIETLKEDNIVDDFENDKLALKKVVPVHVQAIAAVVLHVLPILKMKMKTATKELVIVKVKTLATVIVIVKVKIVSN